MPIDALVTRLVAAARAAFTEVRTLHPEETFYCYALYTGGLPTYILPTCSGERGLRQVAREYVEHGGGTVEGHAGELRWNPDDWPYHLLGAERFTEVNQLLQVRGNLHGLKGEPLHAEVDARYEACFLALAQLDAEGFFGRGAERDRVVVTVLQGDQSHRGQLASARRLNPPAAVEKLAGDLQIPEPIGDAVTLGSMEVYSVTALSYASDARLLAACGSGGELFAWDTSSGRELLATVHDRHGYWDAGISADARLLVVAENDRVLRIQLPGDEPRRLEAEGGFRVAVSADGTVVIAGGHDGTVTAFDVTAERRLWKIDRKASCLRLTRDGTLLALAGHGPTGGVVLLDAADGSLRQGLVTPSSARHCLAWSPDGRALATGDEDTGRIQIWHEQTAGWVQRCEIESLATAQPISSFPGEPNDLTFSPDSRLLASAHGTGDVHVWDATTGRHLRNFRGPQESMHAVAFIDDQRLAGAGRDVDKGPPVYIWHL